MEQTTQLIQDMVSGGYNPLPKEVEIFPSLQSALRDVFLHRTLSDPLAWEAAGRTRGWALHPEEIQDGKSHYTSYAMRFFENVIMRKMSVEDALAAISHEV